MTITIGIILGLLIAALAALGLFAWLVNRLWKSF